MDNLELAHLFYNNLPNEMNEDYLLINGSCANYKEESSMEKQFNHQSFYDEIHQ